MLLRSRLGLSCLRVTCGIIIQNSSKFVIASVQEPNGASFGINQGVNRSAGISQLAVEPVLHHQKLSHDEQFDQSSHKIKRKCDDTVHQKHNFYLALTLVNVKLVVSDDIAIGVETSLRKFNLNELDDIVRKEKNDRSIVKIIDESQ